MDAFVKQTMPASGDMARIFAIVKQLKSGHSLSRLQDVTTLGCALRIKKESAGQTEVVGELNPVVLHLGQELGLPLSLLPAHQVPRSSTWNSPAPLMPG